MEDQYYMIKGMLSELNQATQDAIFKGVKEAKSTIIAAGETAYKEAGDVDKFSKEELCAIIYGMATYEVMKELNIPT
jgi:hypothetical protein